MRTSGECVRFRLFLFPAVIVAACGGRVTPEINAGEADDDGDGYTVDGGDCDDSDSAVNPGESEVCGDGLDNDCDGDGDGADYQCMSECERAAVDRSSVGCLYFAVDTNPMHSWIPGDFAVAVSNVDPATSANVAVEVKEAGAWTPVAGGTFTVSPLDLQTLVLPHRYIDGSAISAGGAYRITSDLPVIAYQFNPLDGSSSYLSDASLLLPASAYDSYYIVPAWPYGPADEASDSGHPAHIQIAASQPTEVTVTTPITTQAGTGVPPLSPRAPQTFHLDEGDFLQLTVQNFGESLSGTYVQSTSPVAVWSSNDCANVPATGSACCCEHLEEQIFGLQTWGTSYVASQGPMRSGSEPAIWQIMAQDEGTTVTFTAPPGVAGLPPSVTLGASQEIQLEVRGGGATGGDFLVEASAPILVNQYSVGALYAGSGDVGDPDMVQAIPVEQYLDSYVILVPGTWVNDYLVLVREAGSPVFIDGDAPSVAWQTVAGGKEVARVPVPDGVHVLTGAAPFGVTVVGYDSYDSYAYPGGLNQQVINPVD
jgi:hypothetical protein